MTTRKPAERQVATGTTTSHVNPAQAPGPLPIPIGSAVPVGQMATPLPGAYSRPIPAAAHTPIPAPIPLAAQPPGGAAVHGPTSGLARPIPAPARPVPLSPSDKPRVHAEDEEPPPADPTKIAVKNAPPWLVSLVVHMVLIIIMALIWFVPPTDDVVELVMETVYAEKLGEQTLEDQLQSPEEMNLEIEPALAFSNKLVEDPLSAPPVLNINLLDANAAVSDVPTVVIGSPLSGREEGGKKALLAAYGGTATTEASVREGLLWLKRNQQRDGSWSLMGPYSDGAPYNDNKVAATAMALLAFQGAGHTHRTGDFKDVVAKGWAALLKMQNADGFFECDTGYNQRLYGQAQATIAICEIYGMTQDKEFKEPARLAVQWATNAQSPSGGWRYVPKEDSDTSVTGWYVMALQSAMMGYLDVDQKVLDKISSYLDAAGRDNQSRYAYQAHVTDPDLTMTAEGLLCRQYLGWKHDDERLRRGVDYLLDNKVNYQKGPTDVYYWYYATQVLHHMDGSDWNQWNAVMREEVPRHQVKTGAEKGSWSPANDEWGTKAGRLYQTCLSIYLLEVYYRHLPIYKYRLK